MSKTSRKNKKKKCTKFKIYLNCGCCEVIGYFKNKTSIDNKFKNTESTSNGIITDDLGNVIKNIDTVYGYYKI